MATCWLPLFRVRLLDMRSSGRVFQVCVGLNPPHLGDGLHPPPQFHSLSPTLWKEDSIVNALYPALLLSCRDATTAVSLPFFSTHAACCSSYELFKDFILIVGVDIELVVLHFFISGIPHRECTCVLCKIYITGIASYTQLVQAKVSVRTRTPILYSIKQGRHADVCTCCMLNTILNNSCIKNLLFSRNQDRLSDSDKHAEISLVLCARTSTCVGIGTN